MTYYSDFDFSLEKETTADIKIVEDEESINQSVKNILLTKKGEVPFNPLFGSNIQQLLFEKMDLVTETLLKNEIEIAIENFEPRVEINNITIEPDYDSLTYYVDIDYIIIKLDTLGSVSVSLSLQGI
jgi:phage baseplate assembly protein W